MDPHVDSHRIDRASQAGKKGEQKVAGVIRFVPRTPELEGEAARRNVFVVLRGEDLISQGFRQGPWATVRGWVCSPGSQRIAPQAVFHGCETEAEARAYWAGAGRAQPWPLLAPRP